MNTRRFLFLALLLASCTATGEQNAGAPVAARAGFGEPKVERLDVPHEYWRPLVSEAAYEVLFEEETEPSCSNPLNVEKRSGTYVCAACYLPLFESSTKFESGTGWPSFFQPIEGHIGTKPDHSFGMIRTEYHCARCGGHQGHVFDDGPEPTGLRYCNNGLALRFIPSGEELPALRGGAR